ncbi:MAG: hypothetical protein HFI31_13270 [Lachnospiraceae bacterium]|nr:hypothetical protein [Lachnospiraceae bacterium]
MIWIKKGETPPSVERAATEMKSTPEWRQTSQTDAQAIRRNWFDQLPKEEIRSALLQEQHFLCFYCMKRIANDGQHTTIEHIIPLSKDKEKALDYKNMAAVCRGGADVRSPEEEDRKRRVLCCDGSKGDEEELTISPYSERMMEKICYYRDGRIYFDSFEWNEESAEAIWRDLNETLCLNGKVKRQDGTVVEDTATQLVKGRKDAYKQANAIIMRMEKKGRLTSVQLQKEIARIQEAEKRVEFAGVILFVLKRKQRILKSQGK